MMPYQRGKAHRPKMETVDDGVGLDEVAGDGVLQYQYHPEPSTVFAHLR